MKRIDVALNLFLVRCKMLVGLRLEALVSLRLALVRAGNSLIVEFFVPLLNLINLVGKGLPDFLERLSVSVQLGLKFRSERLCVFERIFKLLLQ